MSRRMSEIYGRKPDRLRSWLLIHKRKLSTSCFDTRRPLFPLSLFFATDPTFFAKTSLYLLQVPDSNPTFTVLPRSHSSQPTLFTLPFLIQPHLHVDKSGLDH